jgi:valyl-tRNA synthetase
MNIAPGKPLPCFIQNLNTSDEVYIKNNLSIILTLAKLESIKQLSENDSAPESATALVGEMKILIPMAGLVDKEQEILRLNKEIDKLIKHQQQLSGKLNNKKFISGAPKAVVEKEQSKLSSVEKALGDLELQLKKISSL